MSDQLEGLDQPLNPAQLPDLETLEGFAERNGLTKDVVRGWGAAAVIPTVQLGKRRMVNSAMLRQWLLAQDWTE